MTESNPRVPCKYCGRLIPPESTFCWYCSRELVARPERPEMKNKRSAWGIILPVLILLLIVAVALWISLSQG